jgi:signal transduction histidine kinase
MLDEGRGANPALVARGVMATWQVLSVGATGLCVGLVFVSLLRLPYSKVSRFLVGMSLCAAAWALGEVITGFSRDIFWEQTGIAVLYTGSIWGPAVWWGLALRWADERGSPLPIPLRLGTWIPLTWAGGWWVFMMTNPWHGQLLTPVIGDRNILQPIWWVMAIPNYALVLAVVGIEVWVVRRVQTRHARRQAAVMIASSLAVLIANMVYVLWLEGAHFNAILIVLSLSAAILVVGVGLEEERREYGESLEHDVAARTRQLHEMNLDLQRVNQKLQDAQERLLQAERLDTAEYLAGSVAHAINNPLAALRGTVELALQSGRKRDATLDRVLHLTRRIEDVAARTLQLVRQGEFRLDEELPGEILEQVRDEIGARATDSGVALPLKIQEKLPWIVVDRSLIVAALSAIAENAVEATKEGGEVVLEVERLPGLRGVAYRVTDAGPGIPKDVVERIFEPFFTTKGAGTGLGLAIARGVIQGHGGTIQVVNRPGGGTSITVELPLGPTGGVVLGLSSNLRRDPSAA